VDLRGIDEGGSRKAEESRKEALERGGRWDVEALRREGD
jgi:hypothetical protein